MPYGDGNGPSGMGSMTGRGAGFCAGYSVPGYANRVSGASRFSQGRGRGHRNWYYATGEPGWMRARSHFPAWGASGALYHHGPELSPEQEADMLKNHARMMQDEIDAVNERIKDLEKSGDNKKA